MDHKLHILLSTDSVIESVVFKYIFNTIYILFKNIKFLFYFKSKMCNISSIILLNFYFGSKDFG